MGQGANLEKAYELIYEFRCGALSNVVEITNEHTDLLRLLSSDLGIEGTSMPMEQLVLLIAERDSNWNKKTQSVIHQIYELRAAGDNAKATAMQEDFQRNCPSSWYRNIVASL